MQLIGMLDSPYVRRVAVAHIAARIPFTHRPISLFRQIDEFSRINALLKAPTLVVDDGTVLMDSNVILEYLAASYPGIAALTPSEAPLRLSALRTTGLALTMMEKAVQSHYERALRPAERRHQPWIDRIMGQLTAGLAALDAELPKSGWIAGGLGLGDISAACAFGFAQGAIADLLVGSRYPNFGAFCARAEALPAFRAAPRRRTARPPSSRPPVDDAPLPQPRQKGPDAGEEGMTSQSETMRAVVAVRPGGPDVLEIDMRPRPVPGEGEILVKVEAAGVNRPDVMQRMGQHPPPPGASDVLGLEAAGKVAARGPNAVRHAVGARVTALVAGGGYADFCVAHETNALPIPSGLTAVEAAAIPETYFTVWTNVFDRGALKPGETLLVHGGTSGIGTTAIMLAKAFGATVIATAGSDEKARTCERLGADLGVNYRTDDFVARTLAATNGRGADVILDMVGGDYVARNYAAAALDGRIVQIAFLQGQRAKIDLRPLVHKRLIHTGSTLRPRSPVDKAAIADALRAKVWPLIEAGRCKPVIDSVFPLGEAAKAHARMESAAHIGKIVLRT